MQMIISKREAKKIIHSYLVDHQLEYSGLRGETISFSDLARESVYVMTVMGWVPAPEKARHIDYMKTVADLHGFMIYFTEGTK